MELKKFFYFIFRIISINTHTWREVRKFFKKTYNGIYLKVSVYLKRPNFWIYIELTNLSLL